MQDFYCLNSKMNVLGIMYLVLEVAVPETARCNDPRLCFRGPVSAPAVCPAAHNPEPPLPSFSL